VQIKDILIALFTVTIQGSSHASTTNSVRVTSLGKYAMPKTKMAEGATTSQWLMWMSLNKIFSPGRQQQAAILPLQDPLR